MPEEKPLVIDATKEDAILNVFPRAPFLSSQKGFSNSFHVAHYRQPACKTPTICFSQHIISIHLGCPVIKERVLEGCSQTEQFFNGDISITPANQCRTVQFYGTAKFIHLYFEPAFITHAVHESVDADCIEIIPQFKLRDPLIQGIGLALNTELETDRLGSRLYSESMANALAVHLLRHYAVQKHIIRDYVGGLSKYKLRQAIEYINAHLAEDLSLGAIADAVGMSQYHFCRLFKQATGVTPYQYAIQCRVDAAKRLLDLPELSSAQISNKLGFADPSQFSHFFRKHTGISPKTYRLGR